MITESSIAFAARQPKMEEQKQQKRVLAQELSARFRSKEDLHRYMVQQGKVE